MDSPKQGLPKDDEYAEDLKLESLHDFRNILSGILGNIELAKNYLRPESQSYPYILAAERVTRHARQLTQANLVSKERQHPLNCVEVLKECAALIVSGPAHRFHLIDHCNTEYLLEVDLVGLCKCLNNLLINAIESMPDGGIITATLKTEKSGETQYLKLLIADEGTGIPANILPKIFDPRFTTKEDGAGIGLPSVRQFMNDIGGSISIESEPNKGTVCQLSFPVRGLSGSEATRPTAKFKPRKKILFVDDQEIVRNVVEDMLRHLKQEVVSCETLEGAKNNYLEHQKAESPFDLVIIDLNLPDKIDGKMILDALKTIDPEVHAVLASGVSQSPMMLHPKKFGFASSIRKPFTLGDLKALIRSI